MMMMYRNVKIKEYEVVMPVGRTNRSFTKCLDTINGIYASEGIHTLIVENEVGRRFVVCATEHHIPDLNDVCDDVRIRFKEVCEEW